MPGLTRGSSNAFPVDQSDWIHHQTTGSLRLARRWVDCITTTTGKQRNALGKEEISLKHIFTEATNSFFGAARFPKRVQSLDRSNGNPVSGSLLDPPGG